jgi:pimeloyl-ACP methyl ester carboxylesterase
MDARAAQRRARFVPGIVALLATGLIVAGLAAPSAGETRQEPAGRRPGPVVPTLDWTDCGDGFQCATATVPLDYGHPRGQTIELALVRKPALDQANRIGSLFLNPGGPGGSGITFVRTAPPAAFQLVSRFDVVGWDPRGVGLSEPVFDCGLENSAAEFVFERPQTIDPAAFEADVRATADACVANNPALAPNMSTANTARDLDLLRQAVGDEQLNYFGVSYGSAIGATYATMFPGRARAMVIDSPMDVQGYYDQPAEFWREQASSFENLLDRFFTACVAAGPSCGFGGADPEAAFDDLVDRLNREPLPGPDPAPSLNGDMVLRSAVSTLYHIAFWAPFAEALNAAAAGDAGPMLAYLDENASGLGNDAQIAVLSVDQRFDRRVEQYFANGEHNYGLFTHFWWDGGYGDLIQGIWPVEDRGAFRGDLENPAGAAPILLIANTYDPATPYVGAQRLVADLGNARLLTYQGDGHGAIRTFDPCLLQPFVDYLNAGVLPPEGARCVDQRPRFPSATGSRAAATADSSFWALPDETHP